LTNESENALPLDETFWNHIEHCGFTIAIPVSENKMMNVLEVLHDIYDTIEDDPDEGRKLVIMMAAILVASKDGQADKVWEELSVQESMKDLDLTIKEILDEES
jgi:hypothetical protein